FFSSRRRHTRFSRDWSSDVCSSDLANRHTLRSLARRWLMLDEEIKELNGMIEELVLGRAPHLLEELGIGVDTAAEILIVAGDNRSEERRVGKECRALRMAEQANKRK